MPCVEEFLAIEKEPEAEAAEPGRDALQDVPDLPVLATLHVPKSKDLRIVLKAMTIVTGRGTGKKDEAHGADVEFVKTDEFSGLTAHVMDPTTNTYLVVKLAGDVRSGDGENSNSDSDVGKENKEEKEHKEHKEHNTCSVSCQIPVNLLLQVLELDSNASFTLKVTQQNLRVHNEGEGSDNGFYSMTELPLFEPQDAQDQEVFEIPDMTLQYTVTINIDVLQKLVNLGAKLKSPNVVIQLFTKHARQPEGQKRTCYLLFSQYSPTGKGAVMYSNSIAEETVGNLKAVTVTNDNAVRSSDELPFRDEVKQGFFGAYDREMLGHILSLGPASGRVSVNMKLGMVLGADGKEEPMPVVISFALGPVEIDTESKLTFILAAKISGADDSNQKPIVFFPDRKKSTRR